MLLWGQKFGMQNGRVRDGVKDDAAGKRGG